MCGVNSWIASAQKISVLESQANEYKQAGNYTQALACYEKILNRLTAPDDYAYRVVYLAAYTDMLLNLGEFEKVEKMLPDTIYGNSIPLMINLAAALGYGNKADKALAIYDRMLRSGSTDGVLRGKILQNMGFIYQENDDYDMAIDCFRQAEKYLKAKDRAILNSNLALAMAHADSIEAALRLIDGSLKYFADGGEADWRDYIRCKRKKAEILYMNGDIDGATQEFREFYEAEKRWLIGQMESAPKTTRLNLWSFEKPLMSKCFVLGDNAAEFMYEVALTRRLTSLLGLNDVGGLKRLFAVTPRQISKSLNKDEVAIEFVSYQTTGKDVKYAAIVALPGGRVHFVDLMDEKMIYQRDGIDGVSVFDAIKSDYKQDKNRLYTNVDLGNAIWGPIVDVLPPGTTTIYFAPEGVFHFWGIENMPFDGKEKYEMHRLTSTATLIKQSEDRKDKNGDVLVIGGLDYDNPPSPAEDEVNGDVNHEAADLLREKMGQNNLFGNLEYAAAEAKKVNDTIGQDEEPDNTMGEGKLKNIMADYEIIHIATHGYSLDMGISRRPEILSDSVAIDRSLVASGLAMSGANVAYQIPDWEDALLSAYEICGLNLSNVDFVVLSACETARGDITDEGAAGLVRGLKNAGVKTVMATLWSINDRSTMLFMQEFYRLLKKGQTKHEAYVGAQNYLKEYEQEVPYRTFSVSTLASGKKQYRNKKIYNAPYFWAPFILID